jgi:hypothetical protein
MRLILPLSAPAILGLTSWAISWAFAFPPLRYNAYAYHVQMTFDIIFAVMTWIGPLTATGAIIATHKSSLTSTRRVTLYLINGVWGTLSLIILVHFWLAHRG